MKKNILTFFMITAMLTAVGAVADQGVPDAPDKLIVTGTVVNASPAEIILETESGEEIFLIDKEDLYPEPILAGTTVTVWFTERAGHHYATELQVGDHTHTVATLDADVDTNVHVHQEPAPGIEAEIHTHTEPLDVDVDAEVETTTTYETTSTYDADRYDNNRRYGNRLPGTASNHPLFALLGLIGLAGAAIVWQLRK